MNDFNEAALSEPATPGGPVVVGGSLSQASPFAAGNFSTASRTTASAEDFAGVAGDPRHHAVVALPAVSREKAPTTSAFLSRGADFISLGTPMAPAFEVRVGDCLHLLRAMPSDSVQCAVTSPPYWNLPDYGVNDQLGHEATPDAYVAKMVELYREVRRVLRPDGTLWLNIGDSYASRTIPGEVPSGSGG